MTYDESKTKCPHCGYQPRTHRYERKNDKTQTRTKEQPTVPPPVTSRNVFATSKHSGAFYIKSGERLNSRYSVVNVMGFGSFGVAYECFDNLSRKHVVVKEYMPSYLVTRSANGRDAEPLSQDAEVKFNIGKNGFIEENNKLHDNNVECVPQLIECFEQNNTSYAVTELVEAESLSSLLARKGKLSYEATAAIITSVLQGLRRLNRLGTIHGDICPENIIVLSGDNTYLLDYNLSDFNKNVYTQRDSGKPRPGYSAPELYFKDMEIGPWTDVYAAAAVMYKMLTGISLPTAVKRKTEDTVQPLSKLGVPISVGADEAMMKALRLDPKKRTQSPEMFLNGFVGDGFDNIKAEKGTKQPKHAVAPARPSRTPAKPVRHRDSTGFLKGMLVVLMFAIIAVVIYFFISGVLPMPRAVEDLINLPSSSRLTDTTDTDVNVNIYENTDTSSAESSENTDSSKPSFISDFIFGDSDSIASGKLDDIISIITSGFGDKVSEFIDEHLTSSEGTSSEEPQTEPQYDNDDGGYYDDDGNYYDDYGGYTEDDDGGYDDGNYYDDNGGDSEYYGDDNGEYTEEPQESNTFSLPTAEEAEEFVNSFINNFSW